MKSFFLFILIVISYASAAQQKTLTGNALIDKVLKEKEAFRKNEWKRDSLINQVLGSYREEDYLKRFAFNQSLQNQLNAINKTSLSFNDQINLELLQHIIKDELSNYEYKAYMNPILSDEGFHTALIRRANVTVSSKKEGEQFLKMLRDIPRYVDEHLSLMTKGLALGISQPKIILSGYETTYTQHIVDTVEKSVFFRPLGKKPNSYSDKEWEQFMGEARVVIQKEVIPSYRKIKDFFDKEYGVKTRSTLGASHFPDGKAFYENRAKHFTTTNLSSEEIYQIGLKEVDRIKREMQGVLESVHFSGSLKEFMDTLRADPKFKPATADHLLKEAAFIAKKADGKLPSLFGKLPRQPYSVEQVPDFLAPTYTGGRYSGASITSRNAGQYWVNTYNLKSRTLYTLEALTLHEAVPGHHLQIALTQELELPEFRKNLYINAFGEGWGLYSEYLGHEMGFYKDPYSLFGRLTYEMWRACRLVVDVGIHTKDWTREQAVNYLADHTALSLHEVNTEINRYISWPGQALAYKIGEIKIKELRKKAEEQLREEFDIRAFHDMILSNGTVTLSILEKMTDRFIQEQKKKKKNA
jgi:uncharacterized protein (DUF885 family)